MRIPTNILDEEHNAVLIDEVDVDQEIYNRPWGGIPLVYTLGDSGQLTTGMMKEMYEKSDARPGTSDFVGKIAVHDFIYPPDTSESTSTIIVMD